MQVQLGEKLLFAGENKLNHAKMDRERNPLGRFPDREESRFFFCVELRAGPAPWHGDDEYYKCAKAQVEG